MGIYDRDYIRDRRAGGSWGDSGNVIRYLIIANVVVFLLQLFIVQQVRVGPGITVPVHTVQKWLELDTDLVLRGQVWRVITSAFCHSTRDLLHIVFNMLLLYSFGRTIESMLGSREFLWFYLAAAMASSFAYMGLDIATGRNVSAIGASGAVMGVMMLFTWHFPRVKLVLIPIEMRWVMLVYALYDLHPVLLELSGRPHHTGVAHAAHLGGLIFGLLYGKYQWRIAPSGDLLTSIKRAFRSRPNLRIAPGTSPFSRPTTEEARDEEQVDALLEKITRSGRESLTEEELALLRDASQRIRDRRQGGG